MELNKQESFETESQQRHDLMLKQTNMLGLAVNELIKEQRSKKKWSLTISDHFNIY